jgi:hypothetical protein
MVRYCAGGGFPQVVVESEKGAMIQQSIQYGFDFRSTTTQGAVPKKRSRTAEGSGYVCGWGCEEEVVEHNTERELEIDDARDISAMGLAAGGKLSTANYFFALPLLTYSLVQDIYKDPYPATLWNHAAARILHVHILDPVSCEKVTHIVPRPPSIDAKAYTEASGQFFVIKEKVDERLDGGDFDNVKSVSQMDQQVGISTEPEFDPTKPKMCTTCELRLCDCM